MNVKKTFEEILRFFFSKDLKKITTENFFFNLEWISKSLLKLKKNFSVNFKEIFTVLGKKLNHDVIIILQFL